MTITQKAANHIAAHGQHFHQYDGTRVQYALHGHLPYDHTASLRPLYEAYRATKAITDGFEQWFLPISSLKAKTTTRPDQLPRLFKHYMRTHLARPAEANEAVLKAVQYSLSAGDTEWITSKQALANVMAARSTSGCGAGATTRPTSGDLARGCIALCAWPAELIERT